MQNWQSRIIIRDYQDLITEGSPNLILLFNNRREHFHGIEYNWELKYVIQIIFISFELYGKSTVFFFRKILIILSCVLNQQPIIRGDKSNHQESIEIKNDELYVSVSSEEMNGRRS